MDLRVMQVQVGIVPFTYRIGDVEYPRLRLKSHSHPVPINPLFKLYPGNVILSPADIEEGEQERVHADQVSVFQRADSILGSQDTPPHRTPLSSL